jgi:uncharacterized protein YukE
MAIRREERIPVNLAVRVFGMDANGKPFSCNATTLDLTRTGARLGGLPCLLKQGDVIGIQQGIYKARFRVAWVGNPGGPHNGQAGVHCVESGRYIWDLPIATFAKSRAEANLPASKPAPEPGLAPAPAVAPAPDPERRVATRFKCTGGVQVINQQTSAVTWGTVSDISTTGCYIDTATPLPPGTKVNVTLTIVGLELRSAAQVRVCHPAIGMGLSFLQMTPEERNHLDQIVSKLSVPAAADPTLQAIASNTLPPKPAMSARAADLASSISKISAELRRMEALISSLAAELDPRVVREFTVTVDHARQTAWTVQQFLETSKPHRDIYNLLADLEARRIKSSTNIVQELALDADSQSLNITTAGVTELAKAVEQLHRRLSTVVKPSVVRAELSDDIVR